MYCLRPLFKSSGSRFRFDPYGSYTFHTIEVGSDVSIGNGACLWASESSITIGNKVMFGPNVMVIGGDHNTSQVGRFMSDVAAKNRGDDLPVVIEDDIWVGAGVIILKGVRIGRGSIIAAGALVTRDVLPYSVVGGVPARVIRARWNREEIRRHEDALYSPENRTTRAAVDVQDNCRGTEELPPAHGI